MPKTPDGVGYRNTDTSHAAALEIEPKAATIRKKIIEHMRTINAPISPDDTADALGLSVLAVRPRFSELRESGRILDSDQRGTNRSGRSCILWKLNTVEKGEKANDQELH